MDASALSMVQIRTGPADSPGIHAFSESYFITFDVGGLVKIDKFFDSIEKCVGKYKILSIVISIDFIIVYLVIVKAWNTKKSIFFFYFYI